MTVSPSPRQGAQAGRPTYQYARWYGVDYTVGDKGGEDADEDLAALIEAWDGCTYVEALGDSPDVPGIGPVSQVPALPSCSGHPVHDRSSGDLSSCARPFSSWSWILQDCAILEAWRRGTIAAWTVPLASPSRIDERTVVLWTRHRLSRGSLEHRGAISMALSQPRRGGI